MYFTTGMGAAKLGGPPVKRPQGHGIAQPAAHRSSPPGAPAQPAAQWHRVRRAPLRPGWLSAKVKRPALRRRFETGVWQGKPARSRLGRRAVAQSSGSPSPSSALCCRRDGSGGERGGGLVVLPACVARREPGRAGARRSQGVARPALRRRFETGWGGRRRDRSIVRGSRQGERSSTQRARRGAEARGRGNGALAGWRVGLLGWGWAERQQHTQCRGVWRGFGGERCWPGWGLAMPGRAVKRRRSPFPTARPCCPGQRDPRWPRRERPGVAGQGIGAGVGPGCRARS